MDTYVVVTTDDFVRSRLDQMIELRHPLAVLASRMPWQEIEASIAQCFARQVRQGKKLEDWTCSVAVMLKRNFSGVTKYRDAIS